MQYMDKKDEHAELLEKLSQELRRGILILAALSQLDEPRYGYDLISRLGEQGLDIEQGTLYPLLRRLESQGLLDSVWDVSGSRPRRYYQLNETGLALRESLAAEWQSLSEVMGRLLKSNA